MSTVQVFTETGFRGDGATINVGDFNFDTKISKKIVGISHGKEYPFPMSITHVNFKNDAIKSLKIGPYLRVIVYDRTTAGGRYIEFENNSEDLMQVFDLSTNQYDFSDKISRIVVTPIDVKASKPTQRTTVIDGVAEGFRSVDTADEYNLKVIVMIILLVAAALLCFKANIFSCLSREECTYDW